MINELIHPVRIDTPFAVGDVFCYLVTDRKTVLVDCGYYSENVLEILSSHLKRRDLKLKDVDEIWLTHGHPDHFGLAAKLSDLSGAVIYGHPKERANFSGNSDRDLFRAFFKKYDIPSRFIKLMIEQLDWLQKYQQSVRAEPIEEGTELTAGRLCAKVKHTPGHAPGHVVFQTDGGVIFGGDLLLGSISTNALINFDPDSGRRNKSLLQYRKSLRWIRKQRGVVLPGHGTIINDASVIAGRHLEEHEKRYEKIISLLKEEPVGLMDLSQKLFPDAIKKGAVFLVLSEVMGYLDWGEEEKVITRERVNGKILFESRRDH